MVSRAYHLKDSKLFCKKALQWAAQFDSVCYFDSNGYKDAHANLNAFLAVGPDVSSDVASTFTSDQKDTFPKIQAFLDQWPQTWIPGYLTYDLKNELENLQSRHPSKDGFEDAYFFVPQYTLLIGQYNVEIKGEDPDRIMLEIENTAMDQTEAVTACTIQKRMSREEYGQAFQQLQRHIQRGDCYEVNLCQEFYAENAEIHPVNLYLLLNEISKSPFSCFFKHGAKYILSASPERYLAKRGNTVFSQPIKGTAKRGENREKDEVIKKTLASSHKELSENYMIVDLVRNDLTRFARPGTVRVTELAKLYTFPQVHQLISTVSCQVDGHLPVTEAIAKAFPPGSMTGAPKIRAMEIIDTLEHSRRGIYSGGVGYFGPQGTFDFSVVIRSLTFNKESGYLSFHTGGAITALSDEDQEYEECLLKGKAIFELLNCTTDKTN